jgi:hypothetical protein
MIPLPDLCQAHEIKQSRVDFPAHVLIAGTPSLNFFLLYLFIDQ